MLADGANIGGQMKREGQRGRQGRGEAAIGTPGPGADGDADDLDMILDDAELNLNQLEREAGEHGRGTRKGGKLRRERARLNELGANSGLTPIKMSHAGPVQKKLKGR